MLAFKMKVPQQELGVDKLLGEKIDSASWGPTGIVAGTHGEACWHYHDAFSPPCAPGTAGCLHDVSAVPVCLARGDCLLMDSRTFHCGGANSMGERVLFYVSLRRRDAAPRSSTESLREEYKRRAEPLTLSHGLAREAWDEGKGFG